MLQLETCGKGYQIKNEIIPGGAYADDMVLHTNRNVDLQALMNICLDYFDYVGLQMAADGRDKTIYTHNVDWDIYDLYIRDKNKELLKVPYYNSSESYKYLGLWINLT